MSGPLWAQASVERFERQIDQIQRESRDRVDTSVPAAQRTMFDVGGNYTFSFFYIDDNAGRKHVLYQHDVNVFGRLSIDGVHEFFARGRGTYRDYRDRDDSFDDKGDTWLDPQFDRAFYRFDLRRAMAAYDGEKTSWNLTVQAGRQLVSWGNAIALSQDLDAIVVEIGHDPINFQLLAGVTPNYVTDVDSSRPNFNDDQDTTRGFYGGLASLKLGGNHTAYAYGVVQQDYNDRDEVGAGNTRFEYQSFYVGGGLRGNLLDQLLYSTEFVYEGGSTLPAPVAGVQSADLDDISAFAGSVRLDYLFEDQHRTRIGGEVLAATGDDDRQVSTNTLGGNQAGTTDTGYSGFGLANTGLAFGADFSNIVVTRIGVSTFPIADHDFLKRFQTGIDFLVFNKFDGRAPIDEPTHRSGFLGVEADLFVNWQITSDLAFSVRYGAYIPGNAVDQDGPRHFVYTGLTIGF